MRWTYRKCHRSHEGTEEAPPECLDAKVVAHFLCVFGETSCDRQKEVLTSIENSTPPIGDPNATATPAALAAVTISRIFPESMSEQSSTRNRKNIAYLGYVKTA